MSEQTAIERRYGPKPKPARDGDKRQARQRINVEVRTGRRAHPNTIPCAKCGHVWTDGERRHEYHHANGYAAEHHYTVISLCTVCHSHEDCPKAKQTHCKRGHEFTPENTGRKPNGNRICLLCRRQHDKTRGRDAAFWREYRKRKAA